MSVPSAHIGQQVLNLMKGGPPRLAESNLRPAARVKRLHLSLDMFLPILILMTAFISTGRGAIRENIEYGKAGAISLRMDAYVPEGPGPFAGIVIVHGGAWVSGDRKRSVEPLFQPLSNAGFAWFSISYRLAENLPNRGVASMAGLGTAVEDVGQAVAYVKTHAAEFHVDPGRIALIGESAGAQLASMAALRPRPGQDVKAVVAFYCPSDLAALARTSPLIPQSVRDAVGGTIWDKILMAGLTEFSPQHWLRADEPPFLLIHGTDDTVVPFEQSKEMCEKMTALGASCELYTVKGGGHGVRQWESAHLTAYKTHMVEWLQQQLP